MVSEATPVASGFQNNLEVCRARKSLAAMYNVYCEWANLKKNSEGICRHKITNLIKACAIVMMLS